MLYMDTRIGGWFKPMHIEYNQTQLHQTYLKNARNIMIVCYVI